MDNKPPFSRPVKEYTLESYICDEEGREALDYKVTCKYDPDNRVSVVFNYDSNRELAEISYYTYNKDRKLMEIAVETVDGNKKQDLIYEYQNNKLCQITEIAADFKIITLFDDYGNPIEKQNLGKDDTPFSETKYINLYDQKGRLIEKHTRFPSGELDWIDKFTYNDAGLLIEEQKVRRQITSIVKHSYNDKGDLILSDYNPGEVNNETLKREISYDENGDIIEIKEYRKGWCYQDRNNEFGLTGVVRYSYVR